MKRGWIGWIAAIVALAAILIVVADIIHTQNSRVTVSDAPVSKASEAAQSAGASVRPIDPKQTPGTK